MSISETEIDLKLAVSSANTVKDLIAPTMVELRESLTSAEELVVVIKEAEQRISALTGSIRVAAALDKRLVAVEGHLCRAALHSNGEALDTEVRIMQSVLEVLKSNLRERLGAAVGVDCALRGGSQKQWYSNRGRE